MSNVGTHSFEPSNPKHTVGNAVVHYAQFQGRVLTIVYGYTLDGEAYEGTFIGVDTAGTVEGTWNERLRDGASGEWKGGATGKVTGAIGVWTFTGTWNDETGGMKGPDLDWRVSWR